jgi:hypothetical protein
MPPGQENDNEIGILLVLKGEFRNVRCLVVEFSLRLTFGTLTHEPGISVEPPDEEGSREFRARNLS